MGRTYDSAAAKRMSSEIQVVAIDFIPEGGDPLLLLRVREIAYVDIAGGGRRD